MSDELKRFLQSELKSEDAGQPSTATLGTAQTHLENAEDMVASDWMGLGAYEDMDEIDQDDIHVRIEEVENELSDLIGAEGAEAKLVSFAKLMEP